MSGPYSRRSRFFLAVLAVSAAGIGSGCGASEPSGATPSGDALQLSCRVTGTEYLDDGLTRDAICAEVARVFSEAAQRQVVDVDPQGQTGRMPTGSHWAQVVIGVNRPTSATASMTFRRGHAVESVPEMRLSIADRNLNLRSFAGLARGLAAKLKP